MLYRAWKENYSVSLLLSRLLRIPSHIGRCSFEDSPFSQASKSSAGFEHPVKSCSHNLIWHGCKIYRGVLHIFEMRPYIDVLGYGHHLQRKPECYTTGAFGLDIQVVSLLLWLDSRTSCVLSHSLETQKMGKPDWLPPTTQLSSGHLFS